MLLSFFRKYQALLALSALSTAMLLFRIFYLADGSCYLSDYAPCPRLRFVFLIWNTFLAWMPIFLMELLEEDDGPLRAWSIFVLATLFFPNAPYLVTDLIHLRTQVDVPKWYDALLLFSFAYLGVSLALRTLGQMHHLLIVRCSRVQAQVGLGLVLLLSGIGIYLGRVLRWNSWDAFFQPHHLLLDAFALVRHPFQHLEAWLMIVLFSCLLGCAYWVWYQDKSIQAKSPGS